MSTCRISKTAVRALSFTTLEVESFARVIVYPLATSNSSRMKTTMAICLKFPDFILGHNFRPQYLSIRAINLKSGKPLPFSE